MRWSVPAGHLTRCRLKLPLQLLPPSDRVNGCSLGIFDVLVKRFVGGNSLVFLDLTSFMHTFLMVLDLLKVFLSPFLILDHPSSTRAADHPFCFSSRFGPILFWREIGSVCTSFTVLLVVPGYVTFKKLTRSITKIAAIQSMVPRGKSYTRYFRRG
jgi:hypothetical protein